MAEYFLDSGYLIALEFARDQNHAVAQAHWKRLGEASFRLVTTDYIFDEVVTFLASRGHHVKAVEVGNVLLQSPSITLLHVDEAIFTEGWDYFTRHADKGYSLTDCISFVVMRKRDIDLALTFDKHFVQAGFRCEP
jgi:predicted nucleic acid-binding protein